MKKIQQLGISLEEFTKVWDKFNLTPPSEEGDAYIYLRVTDDDRIVYIGQTRDEERRDTEHIACSHNDQLRDLHSSGVVTRAVRLTTCSSELVDVIEQRAVLIARSLGEVFNIVRGGSWGVREKPLFDFYMKRGFGYASCRNAIHGILPKGRHSLRFEGFYANAERAIAYWSDANGWLFFNAIPKANVRYAQRNLERANLWRTWKGFIGSNVDVDVVLVDGALLESRIVGLTDAELTDGRETILQDALASKTRLQSRIGNSLQTLSTIRQ